MKCYAFDRDGTTETSNGPVPINLIQKLKNQGHVIHAIGNQTLCDEANIQGESGGLKPARLRKIKKRHPNCEEYIVIDNDALNVKGWSWFMPQHFMAHMIIEDLKRELEKSQQTSSEIAKIKNLFNLPAPINEEFRGFLTYTLEGKTITVSTPAWVNLEKTKQALENQKSYFQKAGAIDLKIKIQRRITYEIKM